MNNKPNIPNEVFLGVSKEYSWRMDLKVNGWGGIAVLISAFSDVFFSQVVKQWPLGWKVAIVLAQFLGILLWAASLARWIRGMDELHRRITVAAVLLSTSGTFFLLLLWHRLEAAGLFQFLFFSPKHPIASWDIVTVCHGFILWTPLYYCSHAIFNRRFR